MTEDLQKKIASCYVVRIIMQFPTHERLVSCKYNEQGEKLL